ncbi:DUF1365 domain-containing protein [Francisellaceae bacterium]|nr:DUF1365 domain-containing protein [Francisellaceae bacterium]
MVTTVNILKTKVYHKRHFPKVNAFSYTTYYLQLPLNIIDKVKSTFKLGLNKPGLMGFYNKDHGYKNNDNLNEWLEDQYKAVDKQVGKNNILITMPRILGYVFNPVSFWLSMENNNNLKSVLCEVNNTYGETHNYICCEENGAAINSNKYYELEKRFHVSPFLERAGSYRFKFDITEKHVRITIKLYDENNQLKLTTSMSGKQQQLTTLRALIYYLTIPLMTVKVVALIYWQAIKLKIMGLPFINKPQQLSPKVTSNAVTLDTSKSSYGKVL